MVFLGFSLLMLALALSARFRAVQVKGVRAVWFFASLLPSELPWAFGIIQVVATLIFLVAADAFSLVTSFSLGVALVSVAVWCHLHVRTFAAERALRLALDEALAEWGYAESSDHLGGSARSVIEKRAWLKPFSFRRPDVERLTNISYGPHPRQQLDILRRSAEATDKHPKLRPVLLHVHGGGWIMGHKRQQGQPLMHYLTQNGWICVDINYRLGPRHRYPDCLTDVKMAIVWLKENIAHYGGTPQFIALTGGSAGGHLSALSAFTANQPEYQPGFEKADTGVQAVVPMYGAYDFTNSNRTWAGAALTRLLERWVMPSPEKDDPHLWKAASPIFQVNETAPPIFVVHGTNDALVFIEDVRDFVTVLRERASGPVLYAELPGAQHGFDLFHSVRTEYTIEAVGQFLDHCYSKWLDERKSEQDQKLGAAES